MASILSGADDPFLRCRFRAEMTLIVADSAVLGDGSGDECRERW
jgi:hypothetical protein